LNDNLIVRKLEVNPDAIGIFGFSFLDQNADKVQGAAIEGVVPEFDAISNGSYSVARPLYVYVKKAHADLIPGMREFLKELTSDKAWGDYGYMTEKGLIPMSVTERQKYAEIAKKLIPLKISDL
jgi:phosphate transport system substrate-binding protein